MKKLTHWAATAFLLAACVGETEAPASAADETGDEAPRGAAEICAKAPAGAVTVENAWARPAPEGRAMTAAYMTICNRTRRPVRLVGAVSELHETRRDAAGVASMAPISALEVAAGGAASLEPGGPHIMLMRLFGPIARGDAVPVTLELDTGAVIEIRAEARTRPPQEQRP